ncbi:hypothetical protein P4S72_28555 [Vibrio sp. PP-XX7]
MKKYIQCLRNTDVDLEDIHPNLTGLSQKTFTLNEVIDINLDVAFISLPSGQAHEVAKTLAKGNLKIIDLGADFRFEDPLEFESLW